MSALKIKIPKEGFKPEGIFKDTLADDKKNMLFIPLEVNDVKIWTKMKKVIKLLKWPERKIPWIDY